MAVKSKIVDTDGRSIRLVHFDDGSKPYHYHLPVVNPGAEHGLWKAVSGTTAATTIITAPTNGGNLHVLNITLSGEKKNTGTIELRFTDGTNTITVFKASLTDAQVNVSIAGNYLGWKDARLEVVTVADFIYTVLCSYIKQSEGLDYSDWDSLR